MYAEPPACSTTPHFMSAAAVWALNCSVYFGCAFKTASDTATLGMFSSDVNAHARLTYWPHLLQRPPVVPTAIRSQRRGHRQRRKRHRGWLLLHHSKAAPAAATRSQQAPLRHCAPATGVTQRGLGGGIVAANCASASLAS